MCTDVFCAMQVVVPSELMLVSLPGHICPFGSGVTREGGGQKGDCRPSYTELLIFESAVD